MSNQINPNKKLSKIKTAFTEWSILSTAQCYPKIFQAKNKYLQLIWSMNFIIFSCLTFWFVILGLINYLEFDVVSKIRVRTEKELVFPLITICDANPFTTSKSNDLLNKTQFISESVFGENNRWADYAGYAMNKAFSFSDAQKQELGFSLSRSLKECEFYNFECNSSHFKWIFNYKYGNCFQFDSKNLVEHVFLSGNMYGLYLTLGNLENLNEYPGYPSNGLKIFIHNSTHFSSYDEEIYLETGKQSKITMRKTMTYRAPSPYSDCNDLSGFKSDIYQYIKSSNGEYRQKICFELCLQKIIIDACQCFYTFISYFEPTNQIKPCFNFSSSACPILTLSKYSTNIYEECISQCPLECEYVTYEASVSQLDYPNRQHFEELKISKLFIEYENMSLEMYKKTHLRLNIHLKSMEHTEIIEMAKMTAIDLISNLGGVLGIFLGLSIFSLVEIGKLVFRIALIAMRP